MASVEETAQMLRVAVETIDDLIRERKLLAIRAPGHSWRLPTWQFAEPLQSLMPAILQALDLDGWSALAWLERPLGGLEGITPRAAVERGYGARVVQLARCEGL